MSATLVTGYSFGATELVTNTKLNAQINSATISGILKTEIADYAEGDWTAGFTCGTSGTITVSASYKTGAYTKIGRMVTVTGEFVVSSVSSPVGSLYLNGLPFTCGNANKYYPSVSVYAGALEITGTTTIMGYIGINGNAIVLEHFTAGTAFAMAADVKAGSTFIISATYFTD